MPEKERENDEGAGNTNEVTYKVTVGKTYIGEITVPRDARLSDLLAEVERQTKINLREFDITLNGELIQTAKGELKENPSLLENGTLSLLKRVQGGTL